MLLLAKDPPLNSDKQVTKIQVQMLQALFLQVFTGFIHTFILVLFTCTCSTYAGWRL